VVALEPAYGKTAREIPTDVFDEFIALEIFEEALGDVRGKSLARGLRIWLKWYGILCHAH
jgi:hypothetical protein